MTEKSFINSLSQNKNNPETDFHLKSFLVAISFSLAKLVNATIATYSGEELLVISIQNFVTIYIIFQRNFSCCVKRQRFLKINYN